jgi:mono/diheme cytochrome c family protein
MRSALKNPCQGLLRGTLIASFVGLLLLSLSGIPANSSPKQQKDNSTQAKNNGSVYAEIAKVPEKARARRNPFENDAEAIAAGSKLFAQHCAECHGNRAEGGKKGPSLREHEVQRAAPGALFWVLTNGVVRRGMPVWSKLPEPERWQIVSFLKSLRTDTSTGPIDASEAVSCR